MMEMIKYNRPTNKALILFVVLELALIIGSLALYIDCQSKNRTIIAQQDVINQLEHTAKTAIADLADSNEHIRAYELRISQLEEQLKEK